MKALLICSFLTIVSACATNNTSQSTISLVKAEPSETLIQNRRLMVGKWYGSQPTDQGGVRKEICERAPEGTYRIVFRTYDTNGQYKDSVEVGEWGIVGDVYFSIFKGWVEGDRFSPADPSDPYNYDAYKILSLSNERIEYVSVGSQHRFVNEKVDENFVFPEK